MKRGFLSLMISASALWSLPLLAQHGHIQGKLKIDGNPRGTVIPSAPALLTMTYTNHETHTQVKEFERLHGKPMHLIMVSRDLSQFSHVHPYLNDTAGEFSLKINEENDDPDNKDTDNAVSVPGEFVLFSEIVPVGEEMVQTIPFTINEGERPVLPPPQPDISYPTKQTVLYYKEDGTKGSEGDYYRIDFSYDQLFVCTTWFPRFFAAVYKLENNSYVKATNFEPILEIGGHAVMVSYDGEGHEKKFQHFHSFLPENGDNVFLFPFHSHLMTFDNAVYKMWIQFIHEGNRLTLPLVIDYKSPPMPKAPLTKNCAR
jgi:hypothetical protein